MTCHEARVLRLARALAACPPLRQPSSQQDELWCVLQDTICTNRLVHIQPMGSSSTVAVSAEYNSVELDAAFTWLKTHETTARDLPPRELFIRLRSEATSGPNGSARAAQADQLRGFTQVPKGSPLRFVPLDAWLGGDGDAFVPVV